MKSIQITENVPDKIVQFLRNRDYEFLVELGEGACGKTVLLRDKYLNELFVCKKYQPYDETERPVLFEHFVRETKILYKLHHPKVVRVFNSYLYPEKFAGYILMEYVDGSDIDVFIRHTPDAINDLFVQAVDGFAYLEKCGVLHRDIRPGNLMVTIDGDLKIIDLGFAKKIGEPADFKKSITLNWWATAPKEFSDAQYDFTTEVYFLGKLFEGLINQNDIGKFKYGDVLVEMCRHDREFRISSFSEVAKRIRTEQMSKMSFGEDAKRIYRVFADELTRQLTKIDFMSSYRSVDEIIDKLAAAHRNFMLEEHVPDSSVVIGCFIEGSYFYRGRPNIQVKVVFDFLSLLRSLNPELRQIVIANLENRLDAIERHVPDDEPPF
jgi:serine/threonine protein kinase